MSAPSQYEPNESEQEYAELYQDMDDDPPDEYDEDAVNALLGEIDEQV